MVTIGEVRRVWLTGHEFIRQFAQPAARQHALRVGFQGDESLQLPCRYRPLFATRRPQQPECAILRLKMPDLFPRPLAQLEEYMLLDDRPGYRMTFLVK